MQALLGRVERGAAQSWRQELAGSCLLFCDKGKWGRAATPWLPGTRGKGAELGYGRHMGVDGDYLAGEVAALIGAKVNAHGGDVFGSAPAGDLDVVQEDILEHIGDAGLVLWSDDKTRPHAVASDVLLAILKGGVLSELVDAGFGASIGSGA